MNNYEQRPFAVGDEIVMIGYIVEMHKPPEEVVECVIVREVTGGAYSKFMGGSYFYAKEIGNHEGEWPVTKDGRYCIDSPVYYYHKDTAPSLEEVIKHYDELVEKRTKR
jgi:hypothetical protein